jgi:hypothetical protein
MNTPLRPLPLDVNRTPSKLLVRQPPEKKRQQRIQALDRPNKTYVAYY